MTILASNNSQVFAFSPAVAELVGDTDAAVILQQIHYWIEKKSGRLFDGTRWIYKSYKQWQKEFRWRSVSQIRRCIGILRSLGLVKAEQLTKEYDDKNCFWYTVDYEALDNLLSRSEACNASSTGCAEFNTGPVEELTGCVDSEIDSIYIKNSDQKILPQEHNNGSIAAVMGWDLFVEEEFNPDEPDNSDWNQDQSSFFADSISQYSGENIPDSESNMACLSRDNNVEQPVKINKWWYFNVELCQMVIGELTPQFEKFLKKYECEDVEKAVKYYEEVIEEKAIESPQAWLTECLKHRYWETSPKALAKRAEEVFIEQTLKNEFGLRMVDRDAFFDLYWEAVNEDWLYDFDASQWTNKDGVKGVRLGHLMVHTGELYVYTLNYENELEMQTWETFATGNYDRDKYDIEDYLVWPV